MPQKYNKFGIESKKLVVFLDLNQFNSFLRPFSLTFNSLLQDTIVGICIIPQIIVEIREFYGHKEETAIRDFYQSELFDKLQNPATGLWHLSEYVSIHNNHTGRTLKTRHQPNNAGHIENNYQKTVTACSSKKFSMTLKILRF